MKKTNYLIILGIVFMIISLLIMMNPTLALIVTLFLWILLTFMSLIINYREKRKTDRKNANKDIYSSSD